MFRIPHIFVPKLTLNHKTQTVKRLVIAHPKSVQYIQYNSDDSELRIRYITGEEQTIQYKTDPEYIHKLFDDLVFQIKDMSDS